MSSFNPKNRVAGSISGFGEIILSSDGTPAAQTATAPLSTADLIARMQRLQLDLDPNYLNDLAVMIEDHILTPGNVHNLTFGDLGDSALTSLIEAFIPGTVPDAAPSLAITAEAHEFLSDVTVSRPTAIWVTDETGLLHSVDPNVMAVDYSNNGIPMIPLFPNRTNTFIRSSVQAALAYASEDTSRIRALGSSVVANANVVYLGPDGSTDVIAVSDVNAGTGMWGITLASLAPTLNDEDCHVASVFVAPVAAKFATVTLTDLTSAQDLSTITATIDLTTGEVVSKGAGAIAVYVQKQTSGYFRIGMQYAVDGGAEIAMTVAGHLTDTAVVYTGTGAHLFNAFGVNNTKGAGLAPFIPTTGAPVTSGATVLTIDGQAKMRKDEGMVALTWGGYHNTDKTTGLERGTNLFAVDGATKMTLADTTLTVSHSSGSADAIAYGNGQVNVHAFSYAPDAFKHRSSGSMLLSSNVVMAPFSGNRELTIGAVPGYLRSLTIYPVADRLRTMNYLVGEGG